MVRHPNLTFLRPIPEPELVRRIESGEITAQDEIAPATGYWFSIQEIEEVRRHFGEHIKLRALMPIDIENTSSTNTALIQPAHIALDKPARKLRVPQTNANQKPRSPSQFFFGLLLVTIFVGTLLLLWWGSR